MLHENKIVGTVASFFPDGINVVDHQRPINWLGFHSLGDISGPSEQRYPGHSFEKRPSLHTFCGTDVLPFEWMLTCNFHVTRANAQNVHVFMTCLPLRDFLCLLFMLHLRVLQ